MIAALAVVARATRVLELAAMAQGVLKSAYVTAYSSKPARKAAHPRVMLMKMCQLAPRGMLGKGNGSS